MPISDAFDTLLAGRSLSEQQTELAFEDLLSGRLDQPQIAALLALIQARAVTADELVGAARAMRRHAAGIPVPPSLRDRVIDTCGTGGTPKTFNVSTLAAIVAAAAGRGDVLVAKHGNRSRSGRGSAEVLAALGVNIDATPDVQARCLEQAHVCFCFAIHHHPAAKHAAAVRKSLGFPTIFNLIGPLTNPVGATRQLLGCFDRDALPIMGDALRRLGADRAMVVRGEDSMDEITTTTTTRIAHVDRAGVTLECFDPHALGLPVAVRADLEARTLEHAVDIARAVLGVDQPPRHGPARDIVVLNAAMALLLAGAATSALDGLAKAAHAIDSSAAAFTLRELARISNTSTEKGGH